MRRAGKGWSASCWRLHLMSTKARGRHAHHPSAMTRAVLAGGEDDYKSACHEHMLLRYTGRAALVEYKDKPIAEARHQHRATR
jgi:hypothetical protein